MLMLKHSPMLSSDNHRQQMQSWLAGQHRTFSLEASDHRLQKAPSLPAPGDKLWNIVIAFTPRKKEKRLTYRQTHMAVLSN
jgi:hypothetical protein